MPVARNIARQPYVITISDRSGIPIAVASFAPASKIAVAVLRSPARKPVARRLSAQRVGRSLAETQGEVRCDEHAERSGRRAEQREEAPGQRRNAPDERDPETVEKHAGRDLRDRVGDAVRAEQVAQRLGVEAELVTQGAARDGQVDPVDRTDQDPDPQQQGDAPPEIGHPLGGRDDATLHETSVRSHVWSTTTAGKIHRWHERMNLGQ